MTGLAQDEAVRAWVRTELARASSSPPEPGTGKTTSPVDRMVAIVLTGFLKLDQIAAVTFTENAATTPSCVWRDALRTGGAEARAPRVVARASEGLSSRAGAGVHDPRLHGHVQKGPSNGRGHARLPAVADEAPSDFIFGVAWGGVVPGSAHRRR